MSAGTTMIAELTMERFEACLKDDFQIDAGAGLSPMSAELVDVTPLPAQVQDEGQRLPFSIILRSRDERILPQHIYRIEHKEMGALDIFLVPIGPDTAGMRYEAVFT